MLCSVRMSWIERDAQCKRRIGALVASDINEVLPDVGAVVLPAPTSTPASEAR